MKHVLFVASESAPFIKTGGLGSVLGSLPKALHDSGVKISVVIPAYACIPQEYLANMEQLARYPVQLGWRQTYADLKTMTMDGIPYYFIKNTTYFSGSQPYGDISMDIEKFAFFCKAVLEMIPYLEDPIDLIHCHDWQTGLLPVYLRMMYQRDPFYRKIKSIMTIHNIQFQGVSSLQRMKDITGLMDAAFTFDRMEYYGNASMLKGGLACADYITTVSESYAREIMTIEYGEGLHSLLSYRKDSLCGIVNGIDWNLYNPEKDLYVTYPYHIQNFEVIREKNKMALQEKCGCVADSQAFTMGIVSRLTGQKGYELVDGALDYVFEMGGQLYILGFGEKRVEDIFLRYQKKYPNQVYIHREYSDEIAKGIYAGCDITLMPSRFEPCGLNQMMAMRYGCLPLVRATGGLKDTVKDDGQISRHGTGFVFYDYEKEAFIQCLQRCLCIYRKYPNLWRDRMRQAMEENYSWDMSALRYKRLYESL